MHRQTHELHTHGTTPSQTTLEPCTGTNFTAVPITVQGSRPHSEVYLLWLQTPHGTADHTARFTYCRRRWCSNGSSCLPRLNLFHAAYGTTCLCH